LRRVVRQHCVRKGAPESMLLNHTCTGFNRSNHAIQSQQSWDIIAGGLETSLQTPSTMLHQHHLRPRSGSRCLDCLGMVEHLECCEVIGPVTELMVSAMTIVGSSTLSVVRSSVQ
jgi:hypothetical protein